MKKTYFYSHKTPKFHSFYLEFNDQTEFFLKSYYTILIQRELEEDNERQNPYLYMRNRF